MGVPSLLDRESDLRNIAQICEQYLPSHSSFSIRTEILSIFARSTAALEAQEDEESRLALILMFSGELDNFRFKSGRTWAPETELEFLGSKLFLLGWSFPYQNQHDRTLIGPTKSPTSCKLILHEAMRVSIKLIHTFNELGNSTIPSQLSGDAKYRHKVDFFTLWYAVATLYLFLSDFPSVAPSDVDLAFNHIRIAHTILTRCAANDEKHEWTRMAFNMDLVGKWHASGRRLPSEAAIRSRMGASLFYDAMQKMAVLKAEKGGRSYAADLTQPLPDRDRGRGRRPSMTGDQDEKEQVEPAGNATMAVSSMETLGVQEGPLDQTGLWPGWDESIWGWGLTFSDTSQFEVDPTTEWQPQGEPRLFG